MTYCLPKNPRKIIVPPIKCQGIKTRLVRFILGNIKWSGVGRWIEPFLGSGVVLFNVQSASALVNDINPHIIRFYKMLNEGKLSPNEVGAHLIREGKKLLEQGEAYYYEVRERFNKTGEPLDFIFLTRACFNGLMRFNRNGKFNVPFCRKPDRFRRAYITKIVNQVSDLHKVMHGKRWEFRTGDWRECLQDVKEDDFVYLDPPYLGRHTDYYQNWTERDAIDIARLTRGLPCGFAVSMWKQNKYRKNEHLSMHWQGLVERTFSHFYHVGPTEDLRNPIEEVLLIKPGFEAPVVRSPQKCLSVQSALPL
jgi:DNA adenine methylase